MLLLKMVTVNQNDPGNCENIFPRAEIERMREDLVRRVGEMSAGGDSSPCAGVEGTSWQGEFQVPTFHPPTVVFIISFIHYILRIHNNKPPL